MKISIYAYAKIYTHYACTHIQTHTYIHTHTQSFVGSTCTMRKGLSDILCQMRYSSSVAGEGGFCDDTPRIFPAPASAKALPCVAGSDALSPCACVCVRQRCAMVCVYIRCIYIIYIHIYIYIYIYTGVRTDKYIYVT